MSFYSKISSPSIYQDFLNLKDRSFDGVIRFFEYHEKEIQQLDFGEYFDLYATYVESLFESGRYQQYVKRCDWLIEKSIEENVVQHRGHNIYQLSIFRKAAAYYNMDRSAKAYQIAIQLVKMAPANPSFRVLFKRCYLKEHRSARIWWRFIGSLLLMSSCLVIGIELFYFRPLSLPQVATAELSRNVLILMGIGTIVATELTHHAIAHNRLRQLARG